MFRSFRKKQHTKEQVPAPVRKASLPDITAQGVQWPEDLVDIAAIRHTPPPEHPFQGAARISFQTDDPGTTPYHKPFRTPSVRNNDGGDRTISSIYMSHPPSAFRPSPAPTVRLSQRRARVPPKFNLMVVGAQGTGKTSLLRLLLDTADISAAATAEQRASFERFMRGGTRATQRIHSATIDIHESRFDRVLLSVIDTPGLDFHEGRELKLERQVSVIVKHVDGLYAETMSEESKVVRKGKGDEHVHLCIYLIDPSSITTVASRRRASSLPRKTRSETTISARHPDDTPPLTDDDGDSDVENDANSDGLTMSPAELRVIRRLAKRVNVLPVIGRSDSLTDEKLRAVKATVTRELHGAELGFGVFAPAPTKAPEGPPDAVDGAPASPDVQPTSSGNGDADTPDPAPESGEEDGSHVSRPVIRLRTGRQSMPARRPRSRSRSRRELTEEAREPLAPDAEDPDSVANVRFSAAAVARADLSPLLPFALIAPEKWRWHRRKAGADADAEVEAEAVSESTHSQPHTDATDSPVTPAERGPSFAHPPSPPEDLKGVFVRQFRWGTVDVLDPAHCDFAALRTAVLSTHMKVLKTHTREVLYERFRTEKLLARRATRKIGEEQTKKLLEGLGL
ncbi:Septin-domain-containing protein [Gloeopeniophorella convolvens]|nr:Septin-domain-containing protein [Gloeopeniophorella convolvens]